MSGFSRDAGRGMRRDRGRGMDHRGRASTSRGNYRGRTPRGHSNSFIPSRQQTQGQHPPHIMDYNDTDDGYFPKYGRSGEVPHNNIPMCYLDENRFRSHALPFHDDGDFHTSSRCESLPYAQGHAMTSPTCETSPEGTGRNNTTPNFQDLAANTPPAPLLQNQGMQNNGWSRNQSQQNKRKQCDSESGQKRREPYAGHPGSFSEYENPRQYPNRPPRGRGSPRSQLPPRLQHLMRGDQGYGSHGRPNPSQLVNQNYSQQGNLHHSQLNNPHYRQRGNDREAYMASRNNYQRYSPRGHRNPSYQGNPQWRHSSMSQQGLHREYDVANMSRSYEQNQPDPVTDRPLLAPLADFPEYKPPLVPSADLPEYDPPPIPSPDHPEYKTNPELFTDTNIGNGSCSENKSEEIEYGGENLPNSPSVFDVGYEEKLLCGSFEVKTEKGDSKDSSTNSPVRNTATKTNAGNKVSVATTPVRPPKLRTKSGEPVDSIVNTNSTLTDGQSQQDTRNGSYTPDRPPKWRTKNREPVDINVNTDCTLTDGQSQKNEKNDSNTPDRPTQSVPSTVDANNQSDPVVADIDGDCCQDIISTQTIQSTLDTTDPDTTDPDIADIVADLCQGLVDEEESESATAEVPGCKEYYEDERYKSPLGAHNDRREYTPPYTVRSGSAPSFKEVTDMYFDGKETKPQTIPQVVGSTGEQGSPDVESEKVEEMQWKPPQRIDFMPSYLCIETKQGPPVSLPSQSGEIQCEESWSAEIKGHDFTPFSDLTSGTNRNIDSQQELLGAAQKYAGTAESVNQSLDGGETKTDSVNAVSSDIRNVVEGSDAKDVHTGREGSPATGKNRRVVVHEANTESDCKVSDERRVMRRTQSDSTLAGKENKNRYTPDRPGFHKKTVQDGNEVILTAKEPPSIQRRNTSNRGRHSLDSGVSVFATIERMKKDIVSFRGNQQLAVSSENSQNSSVQPDWFDFPDQQQNASYVFTPPSNTNNNYNNMCKQNQFSILASLDDNSSATDSEASPNVNLRGQRRRTRWSDPTPPTNSMTLEEEQSWQRDFRNYYNRLETVYFDTHCHIDFIFKRSGFQGSYEKYRTVNKWTYPDTYAGCLAVFCDPRTFRKQGIWKDILADPTVWGAVGCHPKSATEFDSMARTNLVQMLTEKKVKAVGEIGLDYSGTFHQHKEKQIEVFRYQIEIALDIKFPIVIHCRDAEEDCLKILREMVPSTYRIHRHCFTGCWAEAEEWLRHFPESYIGLTPLITFSGGRSFAPREVARNIPLERLLLETDAPYFVPRKVPREAMALSHPGMAVTVAAEVAQLKGIDIEEVLRHCLHNSEKMYGISINKTRGAHWATQTQQ